MGPAPALSTYEAAAKSIYDPMLQSDLTTAAATHDANINTLNTEKSTINPQYDVQETMLKQSVQSEAATIAQTYSQHLLGNFSGLYGNDMGQMFSKANLQEQNIEQQRTAALNDIATKVANEGLTYNADVGALKSKYQSEEQQYAQSAYGSAVSDYNKNNLELAKLNETANYHSADIALREQAASSKANTDYLGSFQSKARKGGGFEYTGPNGVALNLGTYAANVGQGDPNQTLGIIKTQLQNSNTSADSHALQFISYLESRGLNSQQVLHQMSQHAQNNPGWDWAVDFRGAGF